MQKQELNDVILYQLDKTNKIAKQYSQNEFDRLQLGITVDQWVLLKIIEAHKTLSQKELAIKSVRDPASITRSLDLLEKKKLIQRESINGNKRQHDVQLTKEGKIFIETHMKWVEKHRQKSTSGFTLEELSSLKSMLLKIQDNLR